MLEEVFDEIQLNINWRNKEIKSIETISQNLFDNELKIFLKVIIPLIYSHWEGFIVSSLKIIFQYLNSLKISNHDYSYTFLVVAYEQVLKNFAKPVDFDKRTKYLISLCSQSNKQIKLKERIDTKSNLNFKVLTDIAKKINIDINNFKDYETDLNKLVSMRNSISHGEEAYTFSEFSELKKYVDLLDNLMIEFKEELQTLLQEKKYLKDKHGNG